MTEASCFKCYIYCIYVTATVLTYRNTEQHYHISSIEGYSGEKQLIHYKSVVVYNVSIIVLVATYVVLSYSENVTLSFVLQSYCVVCSVFVVSTGESYINTVTEIIAYKQEQLRTDQI